MASRRKIKVGQVNGTPWYVRPSGSTYGSANGTSYDNAWAGFAAIQWASIQPGDTLYVAGTHAGVTNGLMMNVGKSGVAGSPITIASCETQYGASANDAGTIWSGIYLNAGGWSAYNSIYTRTLPTTLRTNGELALGVESDGTVLFAASSIAECEATVGSVYRDPFTNYAPVYYHPVSTPKDLYLHGAAAINCNRKSYLTIIGLNLRCGSQGGAPIIIAKDATGPTDIVRGITIRDCDLRYGTHKAFYESGPIEDILIEDCVIADCGSGFYHSASDPYPAGDDVRVNSYRITFRRNEFFSTANRAISPPFMDSPGDELAIGSLGGMNDVLIEDNYIHDWQGEGVHFYASYGTDGITCHDVTIRRNRIFLDASDATSMLACIVLTGSNTTDLGDRMKRAKVYNNLLMNGLKNNYASAVGFAGGIRIKLTQMTDPADRVQVYNNTIVNCWAGLNIVSAGQTNDDAPVIAKNNIIASPQTNGYFIRMDNLDSNNCVMNYNDYFGTGLFQWDGGTPTTSFATWKINSSQDANSTTDDPLFVGGGNYSLQSGSPCVNTGTDTGLTDDLAGNPRPVGGYDIGAYERQA